MTAQELAQRLDAKRNGDGWKAKCPAHDDSTPSLSLKEGNDGRVLLKCWAGCTLEDICSSLQIKIQDLFQDSMNEDQFKALAKSTFNATEAKEKATGAAPAPVATPPATLEPLSKKQMEAVAKWRGYSLEMVEMLSKYGIIGHYENNIAFPAENGVHYRKKDDGSWRYTRGAKPNLFVIGGVDEGAHIHVFESQWDAIAYADASGEFANIVATRGARNVKLLDKFLNFSGTLYLWPQNDDPGQKWARDIAHDLNCQIKLAKIPESILSASEPPKQIKDLNEWRLAGATSGDIFNAFLDAKDFPVTEPDALVAEAPAPDRATEQGGGENISASTQTGEDYKLAPTSPAGKPTDASAIASAEGTQTRAPVEQAERRDSGGEADANEAIRPFFSIVPRPESEAWREESVATAAEPPPTLATTEEVATGTVAELAEEADRMTVPVGKSEGHKSTPPTQLAQTLDDTVAFLKRYVVFPVDEQADVIALWVAHSWTFSSFRFTPYLNVCSPEKRCGKTRLLECIQLLVPKPRAMVRPTEAVLFRTIEKDKPTLLLDEIDTIYATDADDRSEGLRAVLNAGFQAGPFSTIPRCVGKDLEPRDFNVFCPKVIAGIGKNLPDTVLDRSIEIRLIRQLGDKKAEKFRAVDTELEAAPIRASLDAWSRASGKSLAKARPSMPSQLGDRQQDMMEPLVAIADEAGGEWPQRAREALVGIGATHEDQSTGVQLLADCRMIFEATSLDKMTSTGLLSRLVEVESDNSPWPTWWEGDLKNNKTHGPARKLAKLLAPFGIKPSTIRIGNDDVAKGYYRSDFSDAWKRYLEPVKGMTTMELGL